MIDTPIIVNEDEKSASIKKNIGKVGEFYQVGVQKNRAVYGKTIINYSSGVCHLAISSQLFVNIYE